jgi:hypothetical protein
MLTVMPLQVSERPVVQRRQQNRKRRRRRKRSKMNRNTIIKR